MTSFPKAADLTQQRRDHITRAATGIIASQGLGALSVRSVANAAECSRGLVEHYFENKNALVIAANAWANKVYLQRVEVAVGDTTGLIALKTRLQNLLPYNTNILDEWKVRSAFWHQGVTIPIVEETNNRSFYAVYSAILEDMRVAKKADEIAHEVPVIETSELLLFSVIGLCMSCISDQELRKKEPLDRRLAMILGFLKTANASAFKVGNPDINY